MKFVFGYLFKIFLLISGFNEVSEGHLGKPEGFPLNPN